MKKLVLMLSLSCSMVAVHAAENQLTDAEKVDGFQMLWDGSTAKGWKSIKSDSFPAKGWEMKEGVLSVLLKGGGGDIITEQVYSNFVLKVEFRLTKAANSGIKYFYNPKMNGGTAPEFQVLDPAHPDAEKGKNGSRKVASLYDVLPAPNAKLNPLGDWNSAMLVCKGKSVEHWLNGEKVLSFERGSPEFRASVAQSKFSKIVNWGETESGHILLQDHVDNVSYRNIKIKVLK
jgi:hypothetical protein